MKMRPFLGWLLVCLMLSGLFVAFATARTGPGSAPSSLQVPLGKVGDHASYATFSGQPDGEWIPERSWAFLAKETHPEIDQSGRRRSAVAFVWEQSSFAMEYQDPPFTVNQSYASIVTTWLDLETRDVIQLVRSQAVNAVYDVDAQTWSFEGTTWRYGPDFWNGSLARFNSYSLYGDVQNLVALQGATLVAGQPVPGLRDTFLRREFAVHEPGTTLLALDTSVASISRQDGRAIAKVQTAGCIRFDVREQVARRGVYEAAWPSAEGEWGLLPEDQLPLLHTTVPAVSNVCFTAHAWYDERTPYPIHYEEHVTINGSLTRSWAQSLAHFDEGAAPIPWRSTAQAAAEVSPGSAWAASATPQHYPGDGTGARLPFALSVAVRSVEEDSALTEFRRWRAAHPDAILVGAEFTSNRLNCARTLHDWALAALVATEKPTKIWSLLYGTPQGQYFVVISATVPGTTVLKNCEFGSLSGPAFTAEDLAPRSITLAAAAEAWGDRSISGREPNYLRWGGIWLCRENEDYSHAHMCESGVHVIQLRPLDLERLEIGIYESSGAGYFQAQLDENLAYEALELDIVSGEVESYFLTGARYEHLAPQPRMELTGPRAVAKLETPARPAVGVAAAAAAVSGFSAVALVAYLFPLAKFHGTGLLLLVPGYAKLRRDEVLENRLRDDIHSVIRADPGISPPEIQKRVNAGWSTIVYHLRVLEKNKLVSSLLDGRHRRFFPADAVDWSKRGRVAALKNERTRQVYDLVLNDPGVHIGAVAERMNFSGTAATWHLQRLQAAGLVTRDREGRRIRYVANREDAAPGPGVEFV